MPQEKEEIEEYFRSIMLLKEGEQLRAFNMILSRDDIDIHELVALTKYIPKNSNSSSFFAVVPLFILVNNDTKYKQYIIDLVKQRRDYLVNRNIEPASLEELTLENTAQMLACMTIYSYNVVNNAVKNLSERTDDTLKAIAKKSLSVVQKGFLAQVKINKVIAGKRGLPSVVKDLVRNKVNVTEIRHASSKAFNKNVIESYSKYAGEYVSSILPEHKNDIETAEKAARGALVNEIGLAGAIAAPLAAVGAEKLFKEDYAPAIATAAVIGVLQGGSAGDVIANSIAAGIHEPIWKAIDSKVALKERKLHSLSMPYAALKGLVNKESKKYSKVIITLLLQQLSSYIQNQFAKEKKSSTKEVLFSALEAINSTSAEHVASSSLITQDYLSNLPKLPNVMYNDSPSVNSLSQVQKLNNYEFYFDLVGLSNIGYSSFTNRDNNFAVPEIRNNFSYDLGVTDRTQNFPLAVQNLQHNTALSNNGFMAAGVVITIAAKFVVKKFTAKSR